MSLKTYEELIKEIFQKAYKEGCCHVGVELETFQCIDCEDSARNCNCHACCGVFCEICQKDLSLNCDDIRMAYYWNKE